MNPAADNKFAERGVGAGDCVYPPSWWRTKGSKRNPKKKTLLVAT